MCPRTGERIPTWRSGNWAPPKRRRSGTRVRGTRCVSAHLSPTCDLACSPMSSWTRRSHSIASASRRRPPRFSRAFPFSNECATMHPGFVPHLITRSKDFHDNQSVGCLCTPTTTQLGQGPTRSAYVRQSPRAAPFHGASRQSRIRCAGEYALARAQQDRPYRRARVRRIGDGSVPAIGQ